MSHSKKKHLSIVPFTSVVSDLFYNQNLLNDEFFSKDSLPSVNISDTGDGYVMELAVPGMNKDDFKVKVDNGILSISAETKGQKEEKEKNYTRHEFSYSSFLRAFTMPENAKENEIKATYDNGILKIKIGKKASSQSKALKIPVL